MVLVMSESDGERSQTGKAGMGVSRCDRETCVGACTVGLLPNPLGMLQGWVPTQGHPGVWAMWPGAGIGTGLSLGAVVGASCR